MTVDQQFVGLLMEEYRALRAEVTQRISSGTQLLGFTAAAVALLAGTASKDVLAKRWVWALGGALLLVLFVYWVWTGWLIHTLGKHLAHLEERINNVMKTGGTEERVLTWESNRHPKTARPDPEKQADNPSTS